MRGTLTDGFIKTTGVAGERVEYFDILVRGLGLRVGRGTTDGYSRVWTVHYRNAAGRQRRFTLGRYPTMGLAKARNEARRVLLQVSDGGDPAQAKQERRKANTFAELCQLYLERHAKPHKKSWREDERLIWRELLPVLGHLKAADIKRRDIIALLDAIVARPAPVKANRVKALVHKIFAFALSRDELDANPAHGIARPATETARERVLSEDELRAVWNALGGEPPKIVLLFKLLALTGQRRGEVCGMRWSEIDLECGRWLLPGARTKNKKSHSVPLVGEALHQLREWRQSPIGQGEFVFPGGRDIQPLMNIKKPLAHIRHVSSVDFRPHDLRRTCATGLSSMGVPITVIAKLLNHSESGITANVYARHNFDHEKRLALTRWDEHVARIASGVARKSPLLEQGLTMPSGPSAEPNDVHR